MNKLKFRQMYEVAGVLPISAYYENAEQFTYRLEEIGFYGDKNYLWFHEKGLGKACYEEAEMSRSSEVAYKIFTDKELFNKFLQDMGQAIENIKTFSARAALTKYEGLSLEEISSWEFERREQEANIFTYYLATQPQNLTKIEEQLKKEIGLLITDPILTNEVLGLLTADERISKTAEEELSWLNIVLKSKMGRTVNKDIEGHFSKYKYLMLGDMEWDPKIDTLYSKLKSDMTLEREEILLRIRDLERHPVELRLKKKLILQKHKLSKTAIELGDIISKIAHIRFVMRVEGFLPFFYLGIGITTELCMRLNLTQKELYYCTLPELKSLMVGAPIISKKELQIRMTDDVYLMAIEDGKVRFIFGEEAKKVFNNLAPPEDILGLESVKGMVAMPGEVVGEAFVFSWEDNLEDAIENLPKDAILVVGQTRPQIVLLIRKCKGIVTDEGGTMSHAAIVAREFNMPCIVGTKNATKLFKSGQKIKLDATNGVASIERE